MPHGRWRVQWGNASKCMVSLTFVLGYNYMLLWKMFFFCKNNKLRKRYQSYWSVLTIYLSVTGLFILHDKKCNYILLIRITSNCMRFRQQQTLTHITLLFSVFCYFNTLHSYLRISSNKAENTIDVFQNIFIELLLSSAYHKSLDNLQRDTFSLISLENKER